MFLVAALILAALGLCCLVDVYVSGNKDTATITALLFTAAACVALCQLADSVLMAMSMVAIVGLILGLALPPVLRDFARKRKATRDARKVKTTATPEQKQ